ncbi:MAG: hypothetical protein OXF88_24720 [Rhodobacteraceae bacterium]|nr:hypothetical protein [Paracoccaceae bacterium]MCY4141411.1 hypothetical protein [Paracoccaceae bacterium]
MLTSSEMTGYSRSIRILRFGLLLGAVGLLAAMFVIGVFWSGTGFAPGSIRPVPESGSTADVPALAAGEDVDCSVMSNSRYADVTTRGDAFSVFAEVARLCGPGPDLFVAEDPTFEIRFHNSGRFLTTSRLAELDFGEETAVLTGGVRIETAGGTVAETSEILVDFRERRGLSRSKVYAHGPFGVIEAGMMEISLDIPEDGRKPASGVDVDSTLTFAKGVMITFNPLDQRD